jgi:allantoicase
LVEIVFELWHKCHWLKFTYNIISACYVNDEREAEIKQIFNGHPWKTLLSPKKLRAHHRHYYNGNDINNVGVISHVRLSMAPDGGISRMRLWGYKQSNKQAKL